MHPPLYYLALRAWNAVCRLALRCPEPAETWTLLDFNVAQIETAGVFDWESDGGGRLHTLGIFPSEALEWSCAPLAPLMGLRLLSVAFGLGAAVLTWRLGRRLAPDRPAFALVALALWMASGYTLTWDTVIRSYGASALAVVGLALAGLWTAGTGRWRIGGPLIAALVAAAFLTNYVSMLQFPGIAFAIWLWGGASRREGARTAVAFLGGGVIILAFWGRSFFHQTARVPTEPLFHEPLSAALSYHFDHICQYYWSLLFADGVWKWLAWSGAENATLDPLSSLSPETPLLAIAYLIAFAVYASAIAVNLWDLIKRPNRALAILAMLAFLPGCYYVMANIAVPHSLRLHGRHLYIAAPFFYLFLARGWCSLWEKVTAKWKQRRDIPPQQTRRA
ncbi:MAG: hypothetical protein NTW86_15950 [Candidatus Sumerlaeota bacterium]|nr:hypothetical protein [Candidatus Sumerlaeota bacterium]